MSLGVIPVILIIIGLVVVAAVSSLIAYIVTASRRRSAVGSAPSAADQQLTDLEHTQDGPETDNADYATQRAQTRSQD